MITYNKLGKYGRFGNQLFHIASTIGIAKKHGYKYGFPEWEEWRHFKNYLPFFDKELPEVKLKSKRGLLMEYEELEIPNNVSILGHFFSEKYFEHCKGLIRYHFEMKKITGLPKIKKNSICIHVRAGDFGSRMFPRLTMEYYDKSLEWLESQGYGNYPVYVFSDEIKTAKKLFNFPYFEYIETNDYIKDFYLMTQCKHFIIANSTFSWWAAWLGKNPDKKVIAPKNQVGAIYTDELYPEGWEVV